MFHLTYNVHTFNKRGIKKKDAYEFEMAAIVKKKSLLFYEITHRSGLDLSTNRLMNLQHKI